MPRASQFLPEDLIDVAVSALEAGGPAAVQARKIAAELGASTMAVYTHFGGMTGLWDAMVSHGFARLAEQVRAVPLTDDPMADFFTQGLAYRAWALGHPQYYRLIFGLSGADGAKGARHLDRDISGTVAMSAAGEDAFSVMTASVERMIAAGQIATSDAVSAAGQFLSATHGYVLLEIAGYLPADGSGPITVLAPLARSIMVGLGAAPDSTERAMAAALARATGVPG